MRTMQFRLYILLYALILIIPKAVHADDRPLLPRCWQGDFNLCGYIDAEVWKKESKTVFILEPIYESAFDFSDKLAAVKIDGKFGYIDPTGKIIIAPKYQKAAEFSHGLAVVHDDGKAGVIDRAGNYVIHPVFLRAHILNNKVLLASNSVKGSLSSIGTSFNISEAGLYHIDKGWLTEKIYRFEYFGDAKYGLIKAQVPNSSRGTFDDDYGIMQADGNWLIGPEFTYISDLIDGNAIVRKRIDDNIISGVIDRHGRVIIPFKFDYLTHWEDGFLLAGQGEYKKRKFGLVNEAGELLSDRYFDEIERPDRNRTAIHKWDFFSVRDGDEWKSLTKTGILTKDKRVGQIYLACDQFRILHSVNGLMIVPNDKSLPEISFKKLSFPFTNRTCSPAPTLIGEGGFANILENGSVFGGFYKNSADFFGPNLWVKLDGKWGLVDSIGNIVLEPIYDKIWLENRNRINNQVPSDEDDRTYKVSIEDISYRLRFIDGTYQQEVFTEFDKDTSGIISCKGGYKLYSNNGLWGMVDKEGNDFIPAQYRALTCFNRGTAWVPDDKKGKWCQIDRYNQLRDDNLCRETYYSIFQSHSEPEKFDDDPYESSVLWMRAWLDYGAKQRDQQPLFIPWDR